MGFFGKKKSKTESSSPSKSSSRPGSASTSDYAARQQERREQLLKSLPYANKSVRFASEVSDDEGGFVTDSELEINRSTRYGSLRVRPSAPMVLSVSKSGTLDRSAIARSQSYDTGRSHSYSERQQHFHPLRTDGGSLWTSNGVSRPYKNGTTTIDDDYMSDSSTASSFARGARLRSSLPIIKHVSSKPVGLVFLTYQNETKKTVLPNEIKNLDTIKVMFLRCFPQQLTPDMLNSPKRRFYILDRSSNKFFLLIHLQEVRDGTMLKLVDSDALTPSSVRRSHSAHSSLTTDSHYFSEPEFDFESSARCRYPGQRQPIRMSLTKETNIDDPIPNAWHNSQTVQQPIVPQSTYHNPGAQQVNHMTAAPSHMTSSSHALTDGGATQGSYIPPQVLQSSVHSTKLDPNKYSGGEDVDNISVSSKDSFTSSQFELMGVDAGSSHRSKRNRMAKMESQIANLTALVQTAITSRPGSSASDRISDLSYHSNRSKEVIDYAQLSKMLRTGVSGTSSSTPQPGVSVQLQESIKTASEKVRDLKTEFKQLRRIHEAQAESIHDTINDALSKIQTAISGIPGANHSPLRSKLHAVDVSLDAYKMDQASVLNQITELEACVSELRSDVVSKRCHVNIAEVEALALNLSKATRNAADMKAKFPRLAKELKSVSHDEMDSVIQQQDFIGHEPEKIEDALRRCKTVTNVLFTLKRLAAVDGHRTAVIPKLHTLPVEDSTKKQLRQQIEMITPNHNDRVKAITNAEKSLARRKEILLSKDVLKFEKSLELATKSLKDAEKLPKEDINGENSLEKLAAQAKQYKDENSVKSSTHGNERVTPVVRRSRAQPKEQSLPFIQNRDSIHWDAESDSDDGCSPRNRDFIDKTDSSASAFTVVNKTHNPHTNYVNGGHIAYSPPSSHHKQSIPSGKVYTSPSPEQSNRRKDLQQQCQKLQQLQQNHRLTSTSPRVTSPPGTPQTHVISPRQPMRSPTSNQTSTPNKTLPNGLSTCSTTTTSTRITNGNGIKPVIAPKPQLRPAAKPSAAPKSSESSDQDSSSSESDNEYQLIKEPKSTTV